MRRLPVSPPLLEEAASDTTLVLADDGVHYLRTVLRLRPGDLVELFDGEGKIAVAEVLELEPEVSVRIQHIQQTDRGESPVRTVLFQALPKGKRFDWILEKATELGVDLIVPLHTKRTVVQLSADRARGRLGRWEKILTAAARQCQRTRVPEIVEPLAPEEAITSYSCDAHFVAHTSPVARSLGHRLEDVAKLQSVGFWIGPEGGFSEEEIDLLTQKGAEVVSLGPRILRADTAGIVALTLIQNTFGGL